MRQQLTIKDVAVSARAAWIRMREPEEGQAMWLELETGGKVMRCTIPSIHERTLRKYRSQIRRMVKPTDEYAIYLHIRSKANTHDEQDTDAGYEAGKQ